MPPDFRDPILSPVLLSDPSAVLRAARKSFPAFYAGGRPDDALKMDGLVLAHAALVVGTNSPRIDTPQLSRAELERLTDASERLFVELRDAVRACSSFALVPPDERARIERILFVVKPPLFA